MKRILMFMAVLAMALSYSADADAQGFLKNLGKKVVEKAKEKAEQKILEEEDKAIDAVINGKGDAEEEETDEITPKKAKKQAAVEESDEIIAPAKKQAKGEAVKSDFVAGTVVIFEDDLKGEQMGEFPSKWDLIENNAEVARMNGKMAIRFEHGSDTEITPLLKDGNRQYLPEIYTLEFDYFVTGEDGKDSNYRLLLKTEDGEYESTIGFNHDRISWEIVKPNSGEFVSGNALLEDKHELNDWNHFALSFNKRALKAYINDQRVINIPNARAMDWFAVRTEFWEDYIDYITNVRLAKGAVELYDRNEQSMTAVEKAIAETGKFVTNNILFETGKATLKPESMEEIQKVADYMKKNPTARFEVQGHTDNQGSDKINDPLSQERAEAVVKALESQGVDPFNLRPVGKGSHEPVADNSTDAGRAKNRRVEFIKR